MPIHIPHIQHLSAGLGGLELGHVITQAHGVLFKILRAFQPVRTAVWGKIGSCQEEGGWQVGPAVKTEPKVVW